MAFIFPCYPFFFLSLYNMLTFKICVGVFSGTFKARMFKFCIHMGLRFMALIFLFFIHFSFFPKTTS